VREYRVLGYSPSHGAVYEGDFAAGKKHGGGVYRWPDGAIYEGAFADDLRCVSVGAVDPFLSCPPLTWRLVPCRAAAVLLLCPPPRLASSRLVLCRRPRRHGRGVMLEANGDLFNGEWAADHKARGVQKYSRCVLHCSPSIACLPGLTNSSSARLVPAAHVAFPPSPPFLAARLHRHWYAAVRARCLVALCCMHSSMHTSPSSGDVYEGEWRLGAKHGFGTFRWARYRLLQAPTDGCCCYRAACHGSLTRPVPPSSVCCRLSPSRHDQRGRARRGVGQRPGPPAPPLRPLSRPLSIIT
jgi:hypothetical protein